MTVPACTPLLPPLVPRAPSLLSGRPAIIPPIPPLPQHVAIVFLCLPVLDPRRR